MKRVYPPHALGGYDILWRPRTSDFCVLVAMRLPSSATGGELEAFSGTLYPRGDRPAPRSACCDG